LTFYKDKLFFYANGNNNVGYEPHIIKLNTLLSSTQNFAQAQIVFYPNPVYDKLNLTIENTIKKIEVFDITGRLEAVFYDSENLDVSTLHAGMKVIRVLDVTNKLHSGRFLKM